jgi:hypothetical protein
MNILWSFQQAKCLHLRVNATGCTCFVTRRGQSLSWRHIYEWQPQQTEWRKWTNTAKRNAPDLLILAGKLAAGKRTSITCHRSYLCSTRVRNWKWTKNVSNLFCTVVPCLYSTLFCMRTDCQYVQLKNKSAPKTSSLFFVTSVIVHNNGYVPHVLFLTRQATWTRESFLLFSALYPEIPSDRC